MGARRTDAEQEKERRLADQERLDELFLRLVGLGGGFLTIESLKLRLQRIKEAVVDAYKAGVSISEMLDLVDTQEAVEELVVDTPSLILSDKIDMAGVIIWDRFLETRREITTANIL